MFDSSLVGTCNRVSLFFFVRVGSLAMMMSMFLGRLAAIVFGVMSAGSSGKYCPTGLWLYVGVVRGSGNVVV